MVRASDRSLYTGITTDLSRRLEEHKSHRGKGAKALRGKKGLRLVFRRRVKSLRIALRLEYAIKRLDKAAKEKIVSGRKKIRVARK